MTTKSGTTDRFPTMKLPKPIVTIHNAVDEMEKAKKRRAKDADIIKNEKAKLAKLLRRHKGKLAVMKNGAILYRLCGYRVIVSENEKVEATIEKES